VRPGGGSLAVVRSGHWTRSVRAALPRGAW